MKKLLGDNLDPQPVIDAIRASDCAYLADEVRERIQPGIHVEAVRSDEGDLELGESRMAASPDVPAGFVWPESDAGPLSCIAQFDLEHVRRVCGSSILPNDGWLYFFYDYENQPWGHEVQEYRSWRVRYESCDRAGLRRCDSPRLSGERYPCRCEFRPVLTVPDAEQLDFEGVVDRSFTDGAASQGYFETTEPWDCLRHQLLGNPYNIQPDPRRDIAQLADMKWPSQQRRGWVGRGHRGGDPFEWILLLQCATDWPERTCLDWGGGGQIYYWIRRSDLADLDFTKVWFQLQVT